MSSTTQPTLDEWIFPAAEDDADDEVDDAQEWLECGHSSSHADETGQCVLCNVSGAVESDAGTKTALTEDQAASSPFDGGIR